MCDADCRADLDRSRVAIVIIAGYKDELLTRVTSGQCAEHSSKSR